MRSRRANPRVPSYPYDGGRGLRVCPERRHSPAFSEWAMAHGHEPRLTIDRIDNDGDYTPENCRRVTRAEHGRNQRGNRLLTIFGETKPPVAWAEDTRCPISETIPRKRLHRGWTPEKALTQPTPRVARLLTSMGRTLPLHAWAKKLRLHHWVLYQRANRGLSPEDMLKPVAPRSRITRSG